MRYQKTLPIITQEAFLKAAAQVKLFNSSTSKRYEVIQVVNNVMHFKRLDASGKPEKIDLTQLYKAYVELTDFATENFRPYVRRRHSPGRGLLIHLKLIGKK